MQWKELISEFNQRFGPESPTPVTFDGMYLRCDLPMEVCKFLNSRLLPEKEIQRFADAHFVAALNISKKNVYLGVHMLRSHPLWDETLGFGRNSKSEAILHLKRKKLPSGEWGCILERPDGDLDSEINLLSAYSISALEREIEGDYKKVEVLDKAIENLTPDFFQEVMSARRVLDYRSSRHLELNCQYGDGNIMRPETRQRLLSKLAAFEGKTEKKTIDRYYNMAVDFSTNISLREYITNAEVLEGGKTCPPELVDEAMDWILNGHNDLLERLDRIVSEAVHHVMDAQHCPHCVDNDCELSCEDNPCTGTAAEQSNCAYRS